MHALQTPPSCPCGHSCPPSFLGSTSSLAAVEYYRCIECGQIWNTGPKPSPSPPEPSDPHPTTPIFVAFIRNEIATGLLFAELSAGAGDDSERRTRHRLNAEKAFESAAKLLDRTPTTSDEAAELRVGLDTLRAVIAALNEPG